LYNSITVSYICPTFPYITTVGKERIGDNMQITGRMIKEMRTETGLSQAQLARLAKISQAHVAKIELEKVDPRLSTANRILRILNTRERRKRCKSLMNPNIISVGLNAPVEEAIKIMHEYNISQLPVMEGQTQLGSIEEATIIKNMSRRLKRLQEGLRE
jgi:predicted transcriptional regulator